LTFPIRPPANDETLIRRFVEEGDEGAFETLIRNHLPSLRRLVAAAGPRDSEDRNDILQETLIQLHKSLSAYRFEAPLSTYMFRIARHAALDLERTRRRSSERELRAAPQVSDFSGNPEELALERAGAAELKNLFYKLKETDRQLLLLREREKMSMEEISEILAVRPGTVKSRLSRARKRARKLYEEAER
jgi:RNA polymerase sigma-70 factor (ECF subfamily)